jgi:hypothetical protein
MVGERQKGFIIAMSRSSPYRGLRSGAGWYPATSGFY